VRSPRYEYRPAAGKRALAALARAFEPFARRRPIETALIADPEPELTLFERLKTALGLVIDTSTYGLAGEALYRQDQGQPVGRVSVSLAQPVPKIHSYGSPLEAAVDHRLSILEQDVLDARAQLGHERRREDDVAAAAALERLHRLERRLAEATALAPIAGRLHLTMALETLERDLGYAEQRRPPVAAVAAPAPAAPIAAPARRSRHPLAEPDAIEYLEKAAMRDAARSSNSRCIDDEVTRLISERVALELRLAEWDRENPRLASQLRAEGSA
jgi:hypothetical protein